MKFLLLSIFVIASTIIDYSYSTSISKQPSTTHVIDNGEVLADITKPQLTENFEEFLKQVTKIKTLEAVKEGREKRQIWDRCTYVTTCMLRYGTKHCWKTYRCSSNVSVFFIK